MKEKFMEIVSVMGILGVIIIAYRQGRIDEQSQVIRNLEIVYEELERAKKES